MKKKRFNNGGSAAIFVKFIVFTAISLGSCKKSETGKAHTATLAGTAVNPTANADSAYNGFLNAFLVKSGGKTYIANGLVDRGEAYMWGQGFMITAVEDAYDRSNSAYRKQVVSDLLTTFITDNESNWSWDSWNDDVAWAIIPFIRGYQITGNTNYLTIATQNWNMAWSRGWDNVTGGGLWENQDKFSKAALSNDPYIISGCFIYEATKDTIYLARCKQIYTWVRASLFDPATGVVNEALTNTGTLQPSDNAYNCGSFINAAASLYKETKDARYLADAQTAADHIVSKFGVMNQEADACVRAIAKLARENNLENKYYPWLVRQCIASWVNRRTDYDISNNDWRNPTPAGEQYAMQCVSAVTVEAVTPESPMITCPNGVYKVISRDNGQALDANGTNDNTPLAVSAYNNSNSQHWALTSIGGGLYKLIGVSSGKSVNISGNSGDDNAPIILWDYNSAANELVYLSSPAAGYYSMFFVTSGKAVTVASGSIIQSAYTGTNNQQWQFLKP